MRGAKARAEAVAEFDLFYAATATRLLRQMILLTGDSAEAEDVVQEAYERAWLSWPTVRDCVSGEAWVRTVARRLAVSRWRRVRSSSAAWLSTTARPEIAELDTEHVALVQALRQLPEKQRVAVVLHHVADLPVEQVAEETGSSVSAVKQQLVRGRAALAELLAEDAGAPPARPHLAVRKGEQ
jgi:RNA polymerase sigma-70 factor, ECF subfamily